MRAILESFFFDRNYKWAIYGAVLGVCICYPLINFFALHREDARVSLEAVGLSCLVLVVGVLLHPAVRRGSPGHSVSLHQGKLLPLLGILAVGMILFVTLQSRFVVRLQARVLNDRLRPLAEYSVGKSAGVPGEGETQDRLRSGFLRIASIADTSYNYQIPIAEVTLSSATRNLHDVLSTPDLPDSTKKAASTAYGSLASVAAEQATNTTPPERLGYVINSTLLFKEQKLRVVGQHSAIVFGGGDMVIENSTALLDGVNLRSVRWYYRGFYVFPGSSVVVRNATIENLDQTLGPTTWVNVEFQHSMIRVSQAPFVLVNVRFLDCDLRWLWGPVASELRERIETANGQPITFAYPGVGMPVRPSTNLP
jgi:hypothetical protein